MTRVVESGGLAVDARPPDSEETPLGRDRDVLQIHGDTMEPGDVEWDVMADPNRGGRL